MTTMNDVATLSDVSEYPGPNGQDGTETLVDTEGGVAEDESIAIRPGVDPTDFLDAVTAASSAAIFDAITQAVDLHQGSFQRAWIAHRRTASENEKRPPSLRDLVGLTRTSTSIWGTDALVVPFMGTKTVPTQEAKPRPSSRAVLMLERARAAATSEVRGHLAAGREVYGRRDGKHVVIKPEK